MTDIAAIGAILNSLKTATDIAKFLRESDLSLERAELKLKLAELVGALADAKLEMASVQELVSDRDVRIKELEEAFQSKDKLVRNRDAYYATDSNGQPGGVPLCLKCWDVDHKKYHLHQEARNRFVMVCPACGSRYEARRAQTISTAEKE